MSDETRPPDLTGPGGRAWRLPAQPDRPAGLGSYLLNRPGAHPFWSWWLVMVCHLREVPGAPPAEKHYPGAEFEFMIITIDPEKCPAPDPADGAYRFLTPPDAVIQFHGPLDEGAAMIAEEAIRAILEGEISPDSDFRQTWKGWISYMAKHYASGAGSKGDA